YSMYNICNYTFTPHKVVWMDISDTVKAAVLTSLPDDEMPIPEHKLMLLAAETADEAYYVAAVLNSDPVNTVIAGYIVDNSVSTHPIENIVIPKFDPNSTLHTRLAALSREAHLAAVQNDDRGVKIAEQAISQAIE